MTNQERAARLHGNGYNCCQAVLLTFCNELGVDPVTAFKIGEGGMENTCGALSGAIMLAGLKNSDGDLDHPKTKAGTYRISRELTEVFKEKTGALVCRDLKGIDTGKVLCSCPKCIDSAVQIVEEILGL